MSTSSIVLIALLCGMTLLTSFVAIVNPEPVWRYTVWFRRVKVKTGNPTNLQLWGTRLSGIAALAGMIFVAVYFYLISG